MYLVLFLLRAQADAQQFGVEHLYMENLGSPQQHGHLPGGEGLDAVQGEPYFPIVVTLPGILMSVNWLQL